MLNSPSPENLLYDSQSSLSSITSRLIDRCGNKNEAAWNLFFHHSIAFIYKQIIKFLQHYKRKDLAANNDVIQDIFGTIATTLVRDGTINELKNPKKLEPWLKRIINSRVVDYLRTENRQKNIAKTLGNRGTTAIDAPIADDSNTTWHDRIPDPKQKQDIAEIMDNHYQEVKKPGKNKTAEDGSSNKQLPDISPDTGDHIREWIADLTPEQQWLLRLKGIFEMPLTQEEITSLADFSGQEKKVIVEEINKLMNRLEDKRQKKLQEDDDAGKCWWVIRDLEKKLQEKRAGRENYFQLQEKIAKKRKIFKKHLIKSQASLVPETKEIAILLNHNPEASTVRFNTMFNRLKKNFQALS